MKRGLANSPLILTKYNDWRVGDGKREKKRVFLPELWARRK